MAADFVQNWLATTPGFATPYLLAALGLIINERAGVLNLGCEGMMLVGAMVGAVVSFHTGLAGAGVPVAMLAGALVGLVFGIAVVVFRADQVLTGLIVVASGRRADRSRRPALHVRKGGGIPQSRSRRSQRHPVARPHPLPAGYPRVRRGGARHRRLVGPRQIGCQGSGSVLSARTPRRPISRALTSSFSAYCRPDARRRALRDSRGLPVARLQLHLDRTHGCRVAAGSSSRSSSFRAGGRVAQSSAR